MIDRCPHCHERVFFTNSVCPGCGGDREQVVEAVVNAPEKSPAADPPPPTRAAFWGALALAILAVWSFAADWAMVSQSGSIDYRNRVTGLRLLADGQDPYHYKWTMGNPVRFFDPFENAALPITKTTVTPATLLTGWPLALLPYPVAKFLWFLAQWALLAGLWWLWFRWPDHTERSRWWWTALVVGFTYTLAWRHHIDRGQAYILWALLLGGWMRLSMAKLPAKCAWLPGLLAGLLVCLRPPLLMVLLPFVVLRRREQWLGTVIGLSLGLGIPFLAKPTVWKDYGRSMETWSEIYRAQTEPRPGARPMPPEVEGMPLQKLAAYKVVQHVDSSLYRLGRAFGFKTIPALAMLSALGALFAAWLWPARRAGDAVFLLGLAAWAYLLDLFLPAYRYPYSDVMILNTLALIPAIVSARKAAYGISLAAIALGVCMVSFLPPAPWPLYLPTVALVFLAMLMLKQSASQRPLTPC
jgi:hypothetical protein